MQTSFEVITKPTAVTTVEFGTQYSPPQSEIQESIPIECQDNQAEPLNVIISSQEQEEAPVKEEEESNSCEIISDNMEQ